MYNEGSDAFVEARFEAMMRIVFGRLTMPNGTPAGEMLSAAVIADRRRAGAAVDRLMDLSQDKLIDTYANLHWLLFEADQGGEMTLPFGTPVKSKRQGGLRVGARNYVLDAGRPGLHETEGVRRDAHGPNLTRLQELIRKKTARLACRRLGVPHGASIFDNISRHLLQFAPCSDAGGVVLQCETYGSGADRFCGATPNQLATFADAIVADMRHFWTRRHAIAARAETVRAVSEAAAAAAKTVMPIELTAITIDMSLEVGEQQPCLYVEFTGLDESLRPGTILDFAPGQSIQWSPGALRMQEYRQTDADELSRAGAHGWIEPLAAAVVKLAPGGAAAVLASLAAGQEAYIAIPAKQGVMHATLFWSEGTIQAEIDLPGVFFWSRNTVELTAPGFPDSVVASLEGKPLASVLPTSIASGGTIRKVSILGSGGLRLTLEEPTYRELRVNLSTGVVW